MRPDVKLAPRTEITRADAHTFVENLFTQLLRRTLIHPAEMEYWTDYLVNGQDAIDVFHRFLASEEYVRLEDCQLATRTAYPAGHFYSPVVDIREIASDSQRIFGNKALLGVKLEMDRQERLFKVLSGFFASLPFQDDPSPGRRYHYSNSSYGFGDACIYWAFMGLLRPERILEVGSGFSSALALDAIDYFDLKTSCIFIDPYPALLHEVVGELGPQHRVIDRQVQTAGKDLVGDLRENDILFIDSSHIAKTGSDVVYEITEMLPRLAAGVVVHFHDVFRDFEYPRQWVLEDNKSWNELYMLHAFLMYNNSFEVLFYNHAFASHRREAVVNHAGACAERFLLNPGGGLWLRRV